MVLIVRGPEFLYRIWYVGTHDHRQKPDRKFERSRGTALSKIMTTKEGCCRHKDALRWCTVLPQYLHNLIWAYSGLVEERVYVDQVQFRSSRLKHNRRDLEVTSFRRQRKTTCLTFLDTAQSLFIECLRADMHWSFEAAMHTKLLREVSRTTWRRFKLGHCLVLTHNASVKPCLPKFNY